MLESQQILLPMMTDSVLDKNSVHVSMLAVDSDEIIRDYAVMAEEDNNEGPLSGISWRDLYSFRTKQAARKIKDWLAKRHRLGISHGGLSAS